MKSYWLKKNNKEKVLLFFTGWGMDQNPFLKINSLIYDVIMFYDYRNISGFDITEIDGILHNYAHADLLAWSMGVWSANHLLASYKNKFEITTALNGTLLPIDDNYGIPKKVFRITLDNLSEISRISFNNRMCVEKKTINEFESNSPSRSIEELKLELAELQVNIMNNHFEANIFNKALITNNDKIIPTVNQFNFWKDRTDYCILEGPHFIFDRLNYWEEITGYEPKS